MTDIYLPMLIFVLGFLFTRLKSFPFKRFRYSLGNTKINDVGVRLCEKSSFLKFSVFIK